MHLVEPWGWIWMLVWIAALLFVVWLLIRTPSQRSTVEDAHGILRARFARGELSQEEFERAREALLNDQREFSR